MKSKACRKRCNWTKCAQRTSDGREDLMWWRQHGEVLKPCSPSWLVHDPKTPAWTRTPWGRCPTSPSTAERSDKRSTEGGTCRWGVPGVSQQAIKEPPPFIQGSSTNAELSSGQIQTDIKRLHVLPASKAAVPRLQTALSRAFLTLTCRATVSTLEHEPWAQRGRLQGSISGVRVGEKTHVSPQHGAELEAGLHEVLSPSLAKSCWHNSELEVKCITAQSISAFPGGLAVCSITLHS